MEITRENFTEVYPALREKILSCSYLSFDLEMTGIFPSDYRKRNKVNHLFSSSIMFLVINNDYFAKLLYCIPNLILQIGPFVSIIQLINKFHLNLDYVSSLF